MGGGQGKPDPNVYLNEAITTEYEDVQLLNNLLSVKLSIHNKDKEACSKLDLYLHQAILDKNIDFHLLIEILDKTSELCNDKLKFLEWLANYVKHPSKDKINRVKVLNYLVVFSVKNNLSSHLVMKVEPEFTYKFLLDLIRTETCKVAYQTFISYFQLCNKPTKIQFINDAYKNCLTINNLDLICALLNHIDGEYFFTERCCFSSDSFWIFIEQFISGDIPHLQKQGIQILTKYVCSNTTFNKVRGIFLSSDTEMAWQAFLLLIDVGREKQLHLVEPSLNLLKYLKHLPFLWQKCCYRIFLQHSQLTIIYKVVIGIFKRVFDSQDELREILKLVLPAINKHEYSLLSCEVFDSLAHFCDCLSTKHFQVVLEEITAMPSWNSVSFWKVIESVLTNIDDKQKYVSFEVIQSILVCANNLTNVYIRNESCKFIVASFWNETNHLQMFNIIKTLINFNTKVSVNYYFEPKIELEKMFFDRNWNQSDQKVWFHILQDSKSNNYTKFKSNCNYNNLSPCLKLLVWRNFLLQFSRSESDIKIFNEIESFLLSYFQQNLYYSGDTGNMFIIVFKMVFSRWAMNDPMFTEVIRKPLFSPSLYKQNQILIALVLVQQYLFTPRPSRAICSTYYRSYQANIRIFFKTESRGILSICFSNLDDKAIMSSIKVDNSLIGIECVNLIYKLASKRTFTEEVTEKTIEQFNTLLESQGNEVVHHIYSKTYQVFLQIGQSPDIVKSLFNDFVTKNLYKNLLQLKKDQYFKDIVTKFTKILCTENFIKYNKNSLNVIFDSLLNISLQCPQIRLNFTKELNDVVSRTKDNFYIELIIDLYLQGVIVTKDERTKFSLCQEFINDSVSLDVNQTPADRVNPNAFDVVARFWALKALITVSQTDANIVINYLTSKYLEYFKKRYFQDSKIHFEKLRLVQAILLIAIQANLSISQKEILHSFALKCIEQESNQNCVTQLLNLILIATLNEPTTVISWIKALDPAPPTVIANLMPTLLHLTLLSNEETFEKTIKLILPWTMGAQFKLRVFAQYCIKQLLAHAAKREYGNVLNNFSYLEDSINDCLRASEVMFDDTLKTDILLVRDFDPLRDLLWSVILYDIPRLNQVHQTEWKNVQITLRHLHKFGSKFYKSESAKFAQFSYFSKAVDIYLQTSKKTKNTELEPIQSEISHIQKKIVPWKSALENDDNESKSCDFILVASLIDKPQNLGGLSRTCEVFGISRIVLNDAQIVADKEFKSLSMSSESWIDPIQVKVKDLWDYIITLQKDGYSLIGAEQTSGSTKLNNFAFPKKMALILGNEKTGIPPEFIPLLDNCVEIPQFGQTRSLNVHVAGATFIWEYAKQHLISKQ